MEVTLQRATDLYICSDAIRECHGTKDKSDTLSMEKDLKYPISGEKDKALIERVGNKMKHASTLEHLVYTFQISGISRAVLQELARHRHASLTVKSSRYTLKELENENPFEGLDDADRAEKYLVFTSNAYVNKCSIEALENLRHVIYCKISNDIAKYCMPESYKTSLTWTLNARSLQNFINLRTHNSALWEIQALANKVYEALPKEHKYLFEHFVHIENFLSAE